MWWTGSEEATLVGAANLADVYARKHGAPSVWIFEEWLDDGYSVHAPVDSLRPNDFGLHHVHGNVWEWCLDGYSDYGSAKLNDPVAPYERAAARVFRGGGCNSIATNAGSSARYGGSPSTADFYIGVRPAADIEP